jgi:adenosylcobinamide-GDP ribazoletransferase
VVGLVLGLVLTGLAALLVGALPSTVLAVALVALLAGMTGGLHIDGLADTFDALGGGRGDRQRMLDLMRDSRIGAHGAAALVLLLMMKVFALAALLDRHDLVAIPSSRPWDAGR